MDGGAPEARRGARAPARRLEGVSAAASVAGPCRDFLARELRQGRSDSVIRLLVKRLDPSVALPAYAHDGDAGLDLPAAHDVTLEPNGRALVATGLAVAIPTGFAGLVLPRSGLAVRRGPGSVPSPGGSFAARTAPDPARPLALLLRGRRRCRRHRAGTAGEIENQQQGPEHRSRRPPHTPPVERQA